MQPKAEKTAVESKMFNYLNVQTDNDKIEMLMNDNETHHSYEGVF